MYVGFRGKGRIKLIYVFACGYEIVMPRPSRGKGSLEEGS